jgi:hypothetical protein
MADSFNFSPYMKNLFKQTPYIYCRVIFNDNR